LHDTLGHALSAITVQLEAVRRVNRREPGAVDPMLAETQALARQAMQELRQYLAGLRDEGDLVSRLEALARETAARNGWQLSLQLAPADVSDEGRRTLLQIAREALTNIERHAGAGSVAVGLRCEAGRVVLSVADDGRGFEPGAHPSGHYGLQGMAERLAELRGELHVESSPGRGSRVTATLPGEGS
jgi:signal transduction histidine kinase